MLVAGILALVLASCSAGDGESAAAGTMPDVGTSLDAPVPASVLDRAVDGQPRSPDHAGRLRGKVLVLSDVMTLCQESCPIITASMVTAAASWMPRPARTRCEFISVTIDPTRDDVRHLRAYERQFGAVPNWTLLTGFPRSPRSWGTRSGSGAAGPPRGPYHRDWVTGAPVTTDIAHTDELIFIDGDQNFRYEMDGYGTVPAS